MNSSLANESDNLTMGNGFGKELMMRNVRLSLLFYLLLMALAACSTTRRDLIETDINTLERTALVDANSTQVQYNLALGYIDQNNIPAAGVRFRKAVDLDPHFSDADFGDFCTQFALSDSLLKRALSTQPDSTQTRLSGLRAQFLRALAHNPFFSWMPAMILLPETEFAASYFQSPLVQANYKRYDKALRAFFVGDHLAALTKFDEILQDAPGLMQIRFLRVLLYAQIGNYRDATLELQVVVRNIERFNEHNILPITLDKATGYYLLATCLYRAKIYNKAYAYFSKTLEVNPRFYMANFWQAKMLTNKGDYSKALVALNNGLQSIPNDPELRYQKAAILTKMGKKQEAAAEYQMITTLAPNYYKAYLNLAIAQEQMNHHEDALTNYSKFLAKVPSEHEKYIAFAKIKMQKLRAE